jgi:hypothetical protein
MGNQTDVMFCLQAIPDVNGKKVRSVKELMDGYTDPYPVWIL